MNLAIPVWALLGFAAWTLIALLLSVGAYRWSRILTGRASLAEWRADRVQGSDFYQRAMRAHANCLENLPVFTAVVVAMLAAGASSAMLDGLAITVLVARVCQTLTHVSLPQTNVVVGFRFSFYFVQFASLFAMGVLIARHAAGMA